MIFGVSLAFLFLSGVPVATAMPPDGYLVEYPIFELDEWGMGGGSIFPKLKGCQEREVAANEWKVSYMSVGKRVYWRDSFKTKQAAKDWMDIHCER
jgi:hypothetical protein